MTELYKGDIFSDPAPLQCQTAIGRMTPEGDWVIPPIVEGRTVVLEYQLEGRCFRCHFPFVEALYSQRNSMLVLLCIKPDGEIESRQISCDCVLVTLGVYTS